MIVQQMIQSEFCFIQNWKWVENFIYFRSGLFGAAYLERWVHLVLISYFKIGFICRKSSHNNIVRDDACTALHLSLSLSLSLSQKCLKMQIRVWWVLTHGCERSPPSLSLSFARIKCASSVLPPTLPHTKLSFGVSVTRSWNKNKPKLFQKLSEK